jgi:hypothetical protein
VLGHGVFLRLKILVRRRRAHVLRKLETALAEDSAILQRSENVSQHVPTATPAPLQQALEATTSALTDDGHIRAHGTPHRFADFQQHQEQPLRP